MKRQRAPLGELCNLVKGTSPISKTPPGPYPLVTTGEEHKTADTFQFDTEAVCIPLISSTGHGHASLKRVHYQAGKFALANLLAAATVKDRSALSVTFLARYLTFTKDRLIVPLMTGAANMSISIARLASIPVEFPPLAKQERIVKLLDEADELRKLRSHADRRISSLIPALFDEMIGDPISNPKGWALGTVGDLTSFITSGSRGWAAFYSEQGARFIRVQNLAGHRLRLDDVAHVNPPQTVESTRTRIQPDDLLLAITGNTIGLSALASGDVGEAYVNQHVAILRLNEKVAPLFMACFMALPAGGQHHIAKIQYGHTKPGISLEQIRAIPVPVPPLPVQIDFAMRVTQIHDLETKQAASRRHLEDLFQSLLHRAFQGEL